MRPSHAQLLRSSRRTFTSSRSKGYYKTRKKKKQEDPFATLGISLPARKDDQEDDDGGRISYAEVKRIFLRIAMKHHPDTTEAVTRDEQQEHREIFMNARRAFEMIAEGPDGAAVLSTDHEAWQSEEDLDAWFRDQTGHDMPFMDAQTMKEVAEMTETVGGGLDRDGGMWTLARMVTENVKKGGDGTSLLQLEAGDIRDRQINGILRRRKRR